MNSLWKDLVYVHSHLLWREDLLWNDQTCTGSVSLARCTSSRTCPNDSGVETGPKSPKDGASHWPRLSAPR